MFSFSSLAFIWCFFISQVHCDFFEEHVKKFLNNSVQPCDDFYRHVCGSNMQTNDYMVEYGNYLEEKWLKEMEEEHWRQSPMSKAEGIIRVLERNHSLYYNVLFPRFKGLIDYFGLLIFARNKMHKLAHPERQNIFPRDQLMRELYSLAREEIGQSTDRFTAEQIEEFENRLERLDYSISRLNKPEHFRETVSAFDQLLKDDEQLGDINEDNIAEKIVEFLDTFKKYDLILYSAMRWNMDGFAKAVSGEGSWYAGSNMITNIRFNDAVLAVTVNTSVPTLYGYFGNVAGHELFHSYQLPENFGDENLGISARCIASHMNRTCHTFAEGNLCESGPETFREDGSDVEGTQLAYKLFVKRIGAQLKSNFSDTGLTNEQMFFYSVGTTICFPDDKAQGGHSAHFVRSNGNLSLMKAFHEAFQCKPGDRMYDIAVGTEDCNTFGAPVRK